VAEGQEGGVKGLVRLHAFSPCSSQWRSRLGCAQASGLYHQGREDLVRNVQ